MKLWLSLEVKERRAYVKIGDSVGAFSCSSEQNDYAIDEDKLPNDPDTGIALAIFALLLDTLSDRKIGLSGIETDFGFETDSKQVN